MGKSLVLLGIEHEQALIEKHVDRNLPGTVDHELRACLAQNGSRIVDELAGMGLDAQTNASLRIRICRTLRSGYGARPAR